MAPDPRQQPRPGWESNPEGPWGHSTGLQPAGSTSHLYRPTPIIAMPSRTIPGPFSMSNSSYELPTVRSRLT